MRGEPSAAGVVPQGRPPVFRRGGARGAARAFGRPTRARRLGPLRPAPVEGGGRRRRRGESRSRIERRQKFFTSRTWFPSAVRLTDRPGRKLPDAVDDGAHVVVSQRRPQDAPGRVGQEIPPPAALLSAAQGRFLTVDLHERYNFETCRPVDKQNRRARVYKSLGPRIDGAT